MSVEFVPRPLRLNAFFTRPYRLAKSLLQDALAISFAVID